MTASKGFIFPADQWNMSCSTIANRQERPYEI
jgi:hypothetical protein